MTENNEENNEKKIEEKIEEQVGEQKEKDEDRQRSRMEQIEQDVDRPKSRMQKLKEEFHMSDSEEEELTKFIASSKNNDMFGILEEMIKYENLNIRQKVAFAHALGIFRTEESMSLRIRSSQD